MSTTNDISIVFGSVRNRSEMSAWIMRQWFNPDKHSMKAWYDSDVTDDNVLAYISRSKHSFCVLFLLLYFFHYSR